jgi:hypothetical protein
LNILVSSSARAGVALENPARDKRTATAVGKPNLCRNFMSKIFKSSLFMLETLRKILEALRKAAMSKIFTLSYHYRFIRVRGFLEAASRQ